MKILVAVNQSRVLYDFKRELVDALLARGDDVWLSFEEDFRASYFEATNAKLVETPIDPRGIDPRKDLKLYFFYRKLLKQIKPDVALLFTIKPNVYCGQACRSFHVPYLATLSGLGAAVNSRGLLSRVSTSLYRLGLKGATRVFCQNESIVRRAIKEKLAREEQIRLVPGSGVDLQRFVYADYPAPDAPIKLLFVGRLMRDKGVAEFVECARRFRERGVKFQMLGAPERRCNEFKLVVEAQKEGVVEYLGYSLDPRPYYREASAIVLPTYHEGLSNVLLEGAASGRPVLASNVPGCLETFDEGRTGLGFQPRDVDALAQTLELFLKKSWNERREMGRRGREKVAAQFNREDVVKKYLQEIDEEVSAFRR